MTVSTWFDRTYYLIYDEKQISKPEWDVTPQDSLCPWVALSRPCLIGGGVFWGSFVDRKTPGRPALTKFQSCSAQSSQPSGRSGGPSSSLSCRICNRPLETANKSYSLKIHHTFCYSDFYALLQLLTFHRIFSWNVGPHMLGKVWKWKASSCAWSTQLFSASSSS